MNPQPKPAPRALRTPKPLKRTTLARKSARPRHRKTTCTSRGCNRVPTAGQMCLTHAKKKADAAWGERVRTDRCVVAELAAQHDIASPTCAGPIQACHGFSRGYMGTRYLLDNGFSGCAAHNLWAELKPLEYDEFLRAVWGQEKYGRLRDLALNFGKSGGHIDYEEVIAALRDRKREGV